MQQIHELVIASGNKNKIYEINQIIKDLSIGALSMNALGITEEIEEYGETLDHNSLIKASYVFDKLSKNTLAEDTGLEVFALNNEPGVRSARYAGLEKNDDHNMDLLLSKLQNQENRQARFRTVATLFWQGRIHIFEGIVMGQISKHKKGKMGFGYDPIFIPNGFDISFAEMDALEKNKISHRGKAIQKVVDFLKSRYKNQE